jgi:hypothetical protein|tara:strand:+ start:109 stop:303 length:195 start_codon:yes stop_codon:yes gene_type:complete
MDEIALYCTDKGKWVTAGIVTESQNNIVSVLQPGDVRLELKLLKPGIYVGNLHGMEFVYDKNKH